MSFGCRKESDWTSVHNVVLGDSDFDDNSPKVDGLSDGIQTRCTPAESIQARSHLGANMVKHEGEDTYEVKGGLSDDEGASVEVKAAAGVEQMVYCTPGLAGVKGNGGDKFLFKVSSKDRNDVIEDSNLVPCSPVNLTKEIGENEGDDKRLSRLDSEKSPLESDEDEVAEDDEFSPCRDLFSAHFVTLASDPKVIYSDLSVFGRSFPLSRAFIVRMRSIIFNMA